MFAAPQRWESDQAHALRALVQERAPRAVTIAVTSGKGGVGKTNLAVNLAVFLADGGLRTCLLDLDLGLANADVLMNIHSRRTLADVIEGRAELHDIILEGPGGVRLVPGASGLERLADLSEFERHHLLQQFRSLESDNDFLIMDLGAGISSNVLSFACAADIVLVVTTPEPTALTDAYATIKLLARQDRASDIELVVNLAESGREAKETYERLAQVASRFLGLALTSAGYVLADDAVVAAVRSRRPFAIGSPSCNASVCVRALAKKLAKKAHTPPSADGFFTRLARMFL